ncbi:ABC-type Fe3+-hydroxamate transport system substrate-binding protein [Rhizobium sp. SORGH_AS 787]|nr:ABC-type Fe3+-hydroxamate transport system substrate-binding protein [Rhizobium sp. SORGH_AS_0787]
MTPSVKNRSNHPLSRRTFSAGILTFLATHTLANADASAPKIAALDWAWAETLLALNVSPSAATETALYRERVITPELPSSVIDLGLRSWPNIELLKSLRPDLIITQTGYGVQATSLEAIAPTLSLPLFTPQRHPLQLAEAGMRTIATRVSQDRTADEYIAGFNQKLSDVRQRLRSYDGLPLLIVKFADERILDIYGAGSLFHDVIGRLGLSNAWTGSSNSWGFSTAGLDAIAMNAQARLVILEPGPPAALVDSDLWRAIPAVRANRVLSIPPTWVFGGLPSAMRFATILGKALENA